MKIYIPAMIRGAVEKGDLDLKMVATPMFPTIPELKVGQIAIWIEFSDIWMDVDNNSIWGGKETDRGKNIKKLVDLFSNGVDIS